MSLSVTEDLDDSTKYRPYLLQGGLGMPDREYYLGSNPRYVELRSQYEAHITNMLRLAGFKDPEARARRVMALEMAIAKAHVSVADTNDVTRSNTVWLRSELAAKAPGLDWTAFLTAAGINGQPQFGAWQPSALAGISKLTATEPLQAWKDYLAFHTVEDAAPRNVHKLGRPVDRGEWFMTPQTVNALFAPCQNSVTLPAAILAPTFFDPNADAAVNYGALGAGLGHEVSHGFDDNGALFDADGNLKNWWAKADMDHFRAEAKKLADQYSAYEPLPGLHINGEQTSTENIADVAGLATAWDAYQLSLQGQPAPVIDGFTAEQRFFLGFAQNYRAKFREAALRRQIVTDILAPAPYRTFTVRNLDVWYSTFDVKPGEKLYLAPAERVKIW